MNWFSKAFNKAAIGLVAAATLAGCGTGQISQTADQASAVNGASATIGELALRDVRIQATQTGDALEPGKTVDLVFVVSNQSPENSDELTDITTSVGNASLTGGKSVPVGGVLIVSAPTGPEPSAAPAAKAQPELANANTAAATVTLEKPIRNGLTYDFTFTFKKAGSVRVDVPISAAPLSHH